MKSLEIDGAPDCQRIEEQLFEGWEHLVRVVQSAMDAFIVVDEQQEILAFSPAAERIFGCGEQNAIGTHLERFIAPRFRAKHAAVFEDLRQIDVHAQGVPTLPTLWGLRANGEEFPCEVSIAGHDVRRRREFSVIIRDTAERQRFEAALHRRMEFETFLFALSKTFIGLTEEEVDANMEQGLARVGEFLQMDRVTLLELSRESAEMTAAYSWSRSGVAPAAPVLTTHTQPWWLGQVLRGDVTLASRVDDLPEEAAAEREYLRQRGVASAASIPLRVSGEIAGAISFITTGRHVSWTADLVNQLRAIADILWNALKRHRALQALLAAQGLVRESEERFRLIASTAPVIIWMTNLDMQCMYVNESWMSLTGWPREAAVGNSWVDLIHPEDLEGLQSVYAKAFDRRERFQMEYRLRRADGEHRWMFIQGVPRYENQCFVGYIGSAIDVTDRKVAETALSTLSQRLIQVQEQERARLARELHDDIGQQLALLLVNLEAAQRRLPSSAPELGKVIDAAKALTSDVQDLSHGLHFSKLNILGLEMAARHLCREVSDKRSVNIHFQSNGVAAVLPEAVSVSVYRVLQEALQNAIKHSGARHIEVSLEVGTRELRLAVRDSGTGFEPNEALKKQGLGLISMKERLKLVEGELTIDTHLLGGTTIRARVPLKSRTSLTEAL